MFEKIINKALPCKGEVFLAAKPKMLMRISLITIGGELLKGHIVNTNAAHVGTMLREEGYGLNRVVTIADDRETILQTLASELNNHDVVLMSGGLGPTNDDITKKTLAEFFNSDMRMDEGALAHIRALFGRKKRMLTERNILQAEVPSVCEVVPNVKGTAPCMLFRQGGKMVFSMPGVPFEMLYAFEHEVLPRILREKASGVYHHRFIRLQGIPESSVADQIVSIESLFPEGLDISYLPRLDGLWLEVSLRGARSEGAGLAEALDAACGHITQLFAKHVYSLDKTPLPAILQEACVKRGLSVAVAESMTGGRVCAKLVSVSGASRYVKGSLVAYDTQVKIDVLGVDAGLIAEKGVASEEVAMAMAVRVRELLCTDIGLATTGRAEKGADGLEAGVWMGYADADKAYAQYRHLYNDREISIERACASVLQIALKEVLAKPLLE